MNEEKLSFVCESFDHHADMKRTYQLIFYPQDESVELYDIKQKRLFLKRSKNLVKRKDLFLNGTVSVNSRLFEVIEYGDESTRRCFDRMESTLAIIKPDAYRSMGAIISLIENDGFLIKNISMVKFTIDGAQIFYSEHKGKQFFTNLVTFMSQDACVALELVAENAVNKWRNKMVEIRKKFGSDATHNAVHGSDSQSSAKREINFFFPIDSKGNQRSAAATTAIFDHCTICIVKPHALKSGWLGNIVNDILTAGFEISALQQFKLDKSAAGEFYEVYRTVVPDYQAMVDDISSGPIVVMEIRDEDAVTKFREFCGPVDPQIAKVLRPQQSNSNSTANTSSNNNNVGVCLRAKYGVNTIQNGVHCTDLVEDGILESEYFFRILNSAQ